MSSIPESPKDFTHRSFHRSLSFSTQGPSLSPSVRGMPPLRAAPSVHGGAGGYGTRISTSRSTASSRSSPTSVGDLLNGNEKTTMQNLNDRLASYLEKVRILDQSNSRLEAQIKQWYETKAPSSGRDYSAYYKQIQELQSQIKDAQLQNARCVLQIDNTKLIFEDFRLKYETERAMHLTLKADLQGLSKVFDDLTLHKTDLELQIEELNRDLAVLKKEHTEEVDGLHRHLGNTVNVEVDVAPGLNLSAVMNEMRQKYEDMAQEYIQKARERYEMQIEALQQEVTVNTGELKEAGAQLKKLRDTSQSLELELQSYFSVKASMEHTLEETKAAYSSQLANLQARLNTVEDELMQVRGDAERQKAEYLTLLDVKIRLEQEIATYRRLLEGEVNTIEYQLDTLEEKDIKKTRKIKTVVQVQEVVDGKVVSSTVKEINEMEENI
ncbi:keratin, type I cytoskeletal 20 [Nycticebus coucang]|uniref:keratin, type I cytoskeletal 20 n=1 Tax=Nycticebus coucang TaxID=9470 RepID=UPI00234C520C|nr:keratin, type I cytoskeletal 20 [Nycticebus coucang]